VDILLESVYVRRSHEKTIPLPRVMSCLSPSIPKYGGALFSEMNNIYRAPVIAQTTGMFQSQKVFKYFCGSTWSIAAQQSQRNSNRPTDRGNCVKRSVKSCSDADCQQEPRGWCQDSPGIVAGLMVIYHRVFGDGEGRQGAGRESFADAVRQNLFVNRLAP